MSHFLLQREENRGGAQMLGILHTHQEAAILKAKAAGVKRSLSDVPIQRKLNVWHYITRLS